MGKEMDPWDKWLGLSGTDQYQVKDIVIFVLFVTMQADHRTTQVENWWTIDGRSSLFSRKTYSANACHST